MGNHRYVSEQQNNSSIFIFMYFFNLYGSTIQQTQSFVPFNLNSKAISILCFFWVISKPIPVLEIEILVLDFRSEIAYPKWGVAMDHPVV